MSNYPALNWVTFEKGGINSFFNDYRPAIGPDGEAVVFERTSFNIEMEPSATQLFIVNDLKNPSSQLFLNNCDSLQQTRPDWSGDNIVLNLEYEKKVTVWTVDARGNNLKQIKNTTSCIYPQWAIDPTFKGFVVMNNKQPKPHSTLLDIDGNIVITNMNGKDTNNNMMLGGMPAVFPNKPRSIAFAGQSSSSGSYNQEDNYIFLNVEDGNEFLSIPMERSANLKPIDKHFQGRAPAISPDGNYIAFESNRDEGYAIYLFNLSKPENPPVQLTDSKVKLNAQHPKFFPDGSRLIFSAVSPGDAYNSIVWIDISEYL
ncbi:hypothetical protein OA93_15010 [Flavobacterium sp. KMS]|uniref:PD40 domain-containing protein n=1 Tax=Flavobacterium sp. KMS TaxID=1566023 RepID=UPI00057D70D8|nr:PD40 domain-containing protein [Flavobacterium sp. KMS]KIA97241.1 hypothetical protein OA93_15010 [Flavobacterium sp. KMS]